MRVFPRRLEGLIFDLDGVLVDTAQVHYRAWKRLADQLEIPFDEAKNKALKGVDRMKSLDLLLSGGTRRFTEQQRRELADRKNYWYREEIMRLGPDDVLAGGREALECAARAGLRLALASASKNAPLVLGRLGLALMFDVVVDPDEAANGKPAPDLFLAAAGAVRVNPAMCLGIEDSAAGIAAIKAAGMWALGIGADEDLPGSDLVLPSISQFRLADFLAQHSQLEGASREH